MANSELQHSLLSLIGNHNARNETIGTEAHEDAINFKSLDAAFTTVSANVTTNMAMCKRVISFSKQIASRDEHLSFFGGNLLGTDRIRFYDQDRYRWFDEVIQLDESYLKESIHAVPAVDKDWKVAGDPFNLSVVWFVHCCMKHLSPNDKVVAEAMREALVLLQFKLLSSVYSNSFEKPVDHAAAEAVYSALTMKFAIKRLGSWGEVLKWRADNFLDRAGNHYRDFLKFDDDERIMYIVTDISTRIRKSIKDQYKILDRVRSGNLRVETVGAKMTIAGDEIIRDKVTMYSNSKSYLLDVAGNESSFIKNELVDVVLDIMTTASRQSVYDVLKAITYTPTGKKRTEVEEFMTDTLLHAFDYIATERVQFNDIGFLLNKLRALYMSSKSSDPRLLSLRTRLEKYAKRHTSLRASSALASVRTTVMLYFILRALSVNIYN